MLDALKKTPLPVILVIVSFICPTELSLVLGDLRLSPHRVAFLVLFPFALYRLMFRPDARFRLYDLPFFILAFWQTLTFTYHAGTEGLAFGGSWALESLGGYLVARAYIRDAAQLSAAILVVFYSIILAAAIAALDTLTTSYFTHELLRSMVGGEPMPPVELRQGFARAAGSFDHPIHYGTYCAVMFALIWMSEPDTTKRSIRAGMIALAAALALSSAPLLSLAMQVGMLIWDRGTRGFPMRTQITLAALTGLYLGVLLVSNRPPVQLLITAATFDPWTGLYRMMIWEYGLDNVWAFPFAGLGMEDWERPKWMVSPTIDAYWLVLAMRSGIPAFLILVAGVVMVARGVLKRGLKSADMQRRRLSKGWMISLIAFCLLGATVHFWNVPHAVLYFFLGLGSALANPRASTELTQRAQNSPLRRRHPSFGPFPAPRPAFS